MPLEDLVLNMNVDRRVKKGEHVDYDGEPRKYTWSVNLETDEHAGNRPLVVDDALRAVEQTAPGFFVSLVTHGNHGHPSDYLHDAVLDESDDVRIEYVERCGCGGYVTRVHVEG
jgi:putative CGCGG family rSAM target protein